MAHRHRVTGHARWTVVITAATCLLLADVDVRPQVVLPTITLTPGDFYFSVDGTPAFLLGTNPVGWMTAQFDTLLGQARVNEKIVRIHLTNGRTPDPNVSAGTVDEDWALFYDQVFDTAELNGLNVLPVFTVWADWNVDMQGWANNPFNDANGGPFTNPADLLLDGTLAEQANQELWLGWLEALVLRWQHRPNIFAWEVFSELNLISDTMLGPGGQVTEGPAVLFAEAAAARVRLADGQGRPVTASQAGGTFSYYANHWSTLASSPEVEFIQIHPYATNPPYSGNLDEFILDSVRELRATYNKPVFIGESGLDSRTPFELGRTPETTLTLDPEAPIGINQAIWAAAVSGAMTGRMLWFPDGYDQFHVADEFDTPLDLRTGYADASAPVASFVAGVDYSDFEPITLTVSADLIGATLGDDDVVLGWVRDILSAAPAQPGDPAWPSRLLSGQTVTVEVPGQSDDWLVDFYDTTTGDVVQTVDADQDLSGDITLTLPDFQCSIGFQIRAVPPLDVFIDIRPRNIGNRINPRGRGVLPVAILTTSTNAGELLDFDASTVAPSTVRFGPGGARAGPNRLVDVGGDGDLDLVLLFRTRHTGLVCGDVLASLTGETFTGRSFVGSDSVTVIGCPP